MFNKYWQRLFTATLICQVLCDPTRPAVTTEYENRPPTEEHGCGSNLTATNEAQSFTSPNHPENYKNYLNCVWIVRANSSDLKVEVQFSHLNTETCCDFVQVRDGPFSDSPVIMPLSGSQNRQHYFVSTYDALYISFKSDDSISGKGFEAEYRVAHIETTCGGNLTASSSSQAISSIGWPTKDYTPNTFCMWTISAPANMQVRLNLKKFQLEPCCDSLMVRDGANQSAKTLTYLRGMSAKKRSYVSTSGVLQIRFRSDSGNNFAGFIAYYKSVSDEAANNSRFASNQRECGKELSAPASGHGNFTSPNFPKLHPGGLNCAWVILAPEGSRVRVWFSFVSTEACCDWIKVRDGNSHNSKKLAVISGNSKIFHSYVSTTNALRVEFDSDDSLNKRGFFAYYEIYKQGMDAETSSCGGNLSATSRVQYFSSPNFPGGVYPHSSSCVWMIRSETGTKVRIVLLGIILEDYHDKLTVYSGTYRKGRKMVSVTGKQYYKFDVMAKKNAAVVVLKSDHSKSLAGFRATYQAVEKIDNDLDDPK